MNKIAPLILSALETIEKGKSIRVTLRAIIEDTNITKEEESMLYYYVFEIYRKLNFIDLYIKNSSSSYSLKKIGVENRSLLRLSTHLLKIDLKSLPDVLELLQDYYYQIGNLEFSTILNSIKDTSEEQLYENRDDLASKLSLQFYLPTWIIRRFIDQWGEKFTLELLPSLLKNPPLYIRVNTLKSNLDKIEGSFNSQNIEYTKVEEVENLLKIIKSPIPIPRIKEYIEGDIVIQQKASAAVSLVLNPQEDERILDMCASPGGKTAHIAALIGSGKGITAVDLNDERTRVLKQRLQLLGAHDITVIKTDARELYNKIDYTFDKILLDPPCSGSGTYSSRPENRWRLKQRDLRWYVNLQKELLQSAARLTKENGCIIYSTCSLFHDENSDIITSFLQDNENFFLEKTNPNIGFQTKIEAGNVQEVFPHLHETEGFFIVKIKRRK
ncbi:MAG: RsmB/NOP family class I SAM-dependent RNA methyltransferase [Candidatus Heimdallarchaeota archaeon]|nr:RsmB/NOP family class I SAM-dependent RNA methyltransferase [Candidatus Heimdallarchaeota archaeon]